MSPDSPKRSTPRGWTRWPATAPSQDSVAGWPSITVMSAAAGAAAGRPLPVGARQEIGPEGLAHLPLGLGDGPGREPEVDGAPVLGLHALEAPAHDLRELAEEGRLRA